MTRLSFFSLSRRSRSAWNITRFTLMSCQEPMKSNYSTCKLYNLLPHSIHCRQKLSLRRDAAQRDRGDRLMLLFLVAQSATARPSRKLRVKHDTLPKPT